jgi:hypothetical protein
MCEAAFAVRHLGTLQLVIAPIQPAPATTD